MPTAMSNLELLNKVKRRILADPTSEAVDDTIKDAIISAEKEIRAIDMVPLAWLRESYDQLFTRCYAAISAITQADPGVITAESVDDDLSSDHGFQSGDIVYIDGIYGMERLNRRLYRATRASATTITLSRMDNQDAIDTTNYEEYDSGGYIYHAGIKLTPSSFEPSTGTADYRWKLGRIFNATFDLWPTTPITEAELTAFPAWYLDRGRPTRILHKRYSYTDFSDSSVDHILLWGPPSNQKYNIRIEFTKEYPDIATWSNSVYPPQIPEVHDAIWRRALSNLAFDAEKQRRESSTGHLMGMIEVHNANHWMNKAAIDEENIIDLNRKMLGHVTGVNSGWVA